MATSRCSRCGRRLRSMTGWNVNVVAGNVVDFICPACQSPEENAEAEINEATIRYSTDAFGRLVGTPKGAS